ncbi:MAG: hypothetical protein MSA60_00560 [Parabacteroides merdae]|jgi:hypothetical protein|uniref:hypothetical protein n=1 Tax=Parabacteroides merdae TaxID=46503 RepID=UPI0011072E32|nr:hypothetical protein [Parabacteroides merdae]MCI6569636.1 hypothetical protein [Parabacteroides merdae]DAW43710.1 MAG TPA: hypothetical protein [Caudoviricetes sp.]
MADQFDIVDIVYDAVEPVSTSFILYKDRSGDGETKNHITIRMLTLNETEVVNKGIANINVFVKQQHNGMPSRQLMKESTRKIKSALREIKPPFGMYWKSRIVWSEPLGEAKEGFDCTNIRFEVITEID